MRLAVQGNCLPDKENALSKTKICFRIIYIFLIGLDCCRIELTESFEWKDILR